MRIIVDSYAWIEYFLGSGKGAAAKKIIELQTTDKIKLNDPPL